jgi:hypothetical protein
MKTNLCVLAVCAMISLYGCSKVPTTSSAGEPAAVANSAAPSLSSTEMQAKVCKRLKQILPKLSNVAPTFAQGLLAAEIFDEFNNDMTVLPQVIAKVDDLASGNCAAERQSILAALNMASLQDAMR